LLAAAGYPDGFTVTLDCPNDRYINDEAICRAAAAMLGEIGTRVTVAARPSREHFPLIQNRETDFYMLGWSTYMLGWSTSTFDSLNHFTYLIRSDGSFNGANYANPRVDELIDTIRTAMVTYARDALIEEVWKTVREESSTCRCTTRSSSGRCAISSSCRSTLGTGRASAWRG
jgi:peptide/nickel transport system substrate-binding protein